MYRETPKNLSFKVNDCAVVIVIVFHGFRLIQEEASW